MLGVLRGFPSVSSVEQNLRTTGLERNTHAKVVPMPVNPSDCKLNCLALCYPLLASVSFTCNRTLCLKKKVKLLSYVRFFAILWTVAYQAPLSMGFSRRQYWSGLSFPSPGDLPDPGIKPASPALQADALHSEPPGKHPHSPKKELRKVGCRYPRNPHLKS